MFLMTIEVYDEKCKKECQHKLLAIMLNYINICTHNIAHNIAHNFRVYMYYQTILDPKYAY